MPFHEEQLQFMIALAQERSPYLNPFFLFLNYFDTIYFGLVLIPLVWIGFSSRWGIRLYYIFLCSSLINSLAKFLVGWPRPCTDMPDIGLLCFPSFGFPSGGAQTAMLMGALLIYYWKNKWAWMVGGAYILLISFSRLYLGVHYPIDILGGWTIAFGLFYLFIRTIDPIEKYLQAQSLIYTCALAMIVPLLMLLFVSLSPKCNRCDAIALPIGMFISFKYHLYLKAPKSIWEGGFRGGVAAIVAVALYLLLKDSYPSCVYEIIIVFWFSLVASPLYRGASKITS